MAVPFQVDAILFWVDEKTHERVLYIDPANRYAILIDVFNESALPVTRNTEELQAALDSESLIKISHDPYSYLKEAADIPVRDQKMRDEAWAAIKELAEDEPNIYNRKGRKRLLEHAADRTGFGRKTLFKWLRRYWQRGKIDNALLPDFWKCGAPGRGRQSVNGAKLGRISRLAAAFPEMAGVNVDEDDKRVFRLAIRKFYKNPTEMPLTRAYKLMCEQFFHVSTRIENGIPVPVLPHASTVPTFWQFRYFHEKERKLTEELKSRKGESRFNLKHRSVLGDSMHMAFGPGSLFEIDATLGDLYLTSALNALKIIGRPVIYTVKDVFSRMIVGLYVGLEGPSWLGAMMALNNTMTDKVAFCAENGHEITEEDWPCHYLPRAILADRGEMLSKNSDKVVKNLNIRIDNTPPYRADWKGIIEQYFRIANLELIHWLPGAVKKRMRERGEPDFRLDACLTLQVFTSMMVDLALFHNLHHRMDWYRPDQFQIMDDVDPVPINLWRWGIANRSGILRELDPNAIKLNLLPRTTASVTREGININGLYYTCERALAEEWFVRARHSGVRHVSAAYDWRRPGIAYLCLDQGRAVEPCRLLPKDQRFEGYWLEEYQEYEELRKLGKDVGQTNERQARAELHARVEYKILQAQRRKDQAHLANPISNAQQIGNIRTNRAEEKAQIRELEAWDQLEQPSASIDLQEASMPPSSAPVEIAEADPPQTSPGTNSNSAPAVPFNRKSKLLSILAGSDDAKN